MWLIFKNNPRENCSEMWNSTTNHKVFQNETSPEKEENIYLKTIILRWKNIYVYIDDIILESHHREVNWECYVVV